MAKITEKIERHQRFWNRAVTDRPLIGFRINKSYFPLHWFNSGQKLMLANGEIEPDLLDVEEFAVECRQMFEVHEKTGQDLFWTAEPFTAVPWLEAMAGCQIFGSENSLWAERWLDDWSQLERIKFENSNPWVKKYNEFLITIERVAQGRFPIGQPILRGPLDLASTLRGATNYIMDFFDNPAAISRLIYKASELFIDLVKNHSKMVKPFYDGYSMGFYHLWTPGKCIWWQEDASALLSPDLYRRYGKEADLLISKTYPYTLIHLHPVSFFILDELLSIDDLKVIQVNKDTEGPSISDMLPVFKRILDKKCLFLWGKLSAEDLAVILTELPSQGLGMQIYIETFEKACELMELVKNKGR